MLLMLVIWLPWCFRLFGHLATLVFSSFWSNGDLGSLLWSSRWSLGHLGPRMWAPRWPLGQMCSGLVLAIWRDVLGPRVGHLAKCCVFWRCCLGPAFLEASFRVAHDA